MAVPKVFVSSTCYDLKVIRENLKYFIGSMGYDSVLSEDGDVYYDPAVHTHEACLNEVGGCQMFVLIIGGRYGGRYLDSDKSITNMEYEAAVEQKIPVFALVDSAVYNAHHLYSENQKNGEIDAAKIRYPQVDNVRIFDFIDAVRKSPMNNAIVPFNHYQDIETYLKKQWAGMMYGFLTRQAESRRVGDLLESIQSATQKIEFYTKLVAKDVGTDATKALMEMYDAMSDFWVLADLELWGFNVTPALVIAHKDIRDLCGEGLVVEEVEEGDGEYIFEGGPPYEVSAKYYKTMEAEYREMRTLMRKMADELNLKASDLADTDFRDTPK